MELRIPRKGIAVLTAAVIMGSAALTASLYTGNVEAVEDKQVTTAPAAEIEIPETTENSTDEYEVTAWWKANLSDYNDNLSLVSYETVEAPEEETEPSDEGVVVNDTGVSYIEQDDYESIQIVPVPERQESEPVNVEAGNFAFTTYGYGHGVGMSQNGANHYASYAGWNYQQILQHYYPGTYIQNTGRTKDTISAGGVSGSVLDIVSMVTYNEVGSSMSNEAIKAQAVAVYTYIMYKGGSAGDLYPKSNPPQNVINAVNSVLGEAVYYNGSFALAMFSASSGGSTALATTYSMRTFLI